MELALFTKNGFYFLLKWGHFLAGVTWIGMLWYFNFVQGSYFKEADGAAKTDATKKLVPRALWWFRWGAMFTFITGWSMITMNLHMGEPFQSKWTTLIMIGGTMGTLMWANVWFVIWPAQKLVIAQAKGESVSGDVAARARRAFLASRTNTWFSIPMLFFMGAARNLNIGFDFNNIPVFYAVAGAIILAVEVNALTATNGITTKPIETVRGVITSGVVLTAVLYAVAEIIL